MFQRFWNFHILYYSSICEVVCHRLCVCVAGVDDGQTLKLSSGRQTVFVRIVVRTCNVCTCECLYMQLLHIVYKMHPPIHTSVYALGNAPVL